MMKIQLQNKFGTKYLYIVTIDNINWGVLPLKLLKSFQYLEDIDELQFEKLKMFIIDYSRERVFKFITIRERSEYETRQYLKKLMVHSTLVEELLEFFISKKFISDSRYAEMYVISLIDLGKSKIEISHKLKARGIPETLIEKEINKQYDREVISNILNENIDRAIRLNSHRPKQEQYDKCASYLMRKGFKYYDFSDILQRKLGIYRD
ncbi:MAG: hypothetical protein B6226_01815 [Candidatus Cloacimonetes bacterium 4572_65]|nr:MAG: hypothetical protein B6226_01815 [Candidatus Cloacimonetes bacterium 4572_65]